MVPLILGHDHLGAFDVSKPTPTSGDELLLSSLGPFYLPFF